MLGGDFDLRELLLLYNNFVDSPFADRIWLKDGITNYLTLEVSKLIIILSGKLYGNLVCGVVNRSAVYLKIVKPTAFYHDILFARLGN